LHAHRGGAHHSLWVIGRVTALLSLQLFLKLLDLVLEIDDIIAVDELALAGVVVFAFGVCPVAGTTFG
jgi:uncharacterized metal-binding protein